MLFLLCWNCRTSYHSSTFSPTLPLAYLGATCSSEGSLVILCRKAGTTQQRVLGVSYNSSYVTSIANNTFQESTFLRRRDASSRCTTAAAASLAGAIVSDLITAEQAGMHAGTARTRPILTSLPLQIFIYFGGWWDVLFWVFSILVFVYKGECCGISSRPTRLNGT